MLVMGFPYSHGDRSARIRAWILRGSVLVSRAWWCGVATETAGMLLINEDFYQQGRTENPRVVGSIPTLATSKTRG